MDELTTIFGSLSRLLAIVGGGISTVAVCYAGILWMTSSGDPQNMSKARMALMGAIGGLIIVGVAFLVPRIIGETVVEPVGGNIGGTESGQNCDDVLRNQFIFQRNASTHQRMQSVISQIQNQRVAQCSVDVWSPEVAVAIADGGTANGGCPAANTTVGGQDVPSGIQVSSSDAKVRTMSGRDRDNNIIIHWKKDKYPTDNAKCWMYTSRLTSWSVE